MRVRFADGSETRPWRPEPRSIRMRSGLWSGKAAPKQGWATLRSSLSGVEGPIPGCRLSWVERADEAQARVCGGGHKSDQAMQAEAFAFFDSHLSGGKSVEHVKEAN